jgi:hypothetical protein
VTGSHDQLLLFSPEEAERLVGLPTDSEARKEVPLARGVLDFFPAALAEVARLSHAATQQHHPDKEMHHDRGKSTDHADCIIRHLAERGTEDTDGILHETKVAWRALALLQEALEAKGAPLARGARLPCDRTNGGDCFAERYGKFGCWCEQERDAVK